MNVQFSHPWTAATIESTASWYYPLPTVCRTLAESVKTTRVIDIQLSHPTRAACAESLRPVRDALETGRGFAIIDAPISPESTALYWIVGLGLGQPMAQNVEGTLLYDVRDTGKNLAGGARVSVTNYESSFHTDNSFGPDILDYVGLLCLQSAKTGGRSQLINGYAVYDELRKHHPDVLAVLSEPFHVDRRGGVRPGETATVQFPVFEWRNGELLVRYLRYWIEAGHEKADQPLTAAQVSALNTLDELLRRENLRVEFDLKPGQMFFINNRWILHNRTAFEDYEDPARRRHLLRLWLQK